MVWLGSKQGDAEMKPWTKDMFTKFQCEVGMISALKGRKGLPSDKYIDDAMAQMTDEEFVAMMSRVNKHIG